MHDGPRPADKEQWVIWNGGSGILMTATIGRIEVDAGGRRAWMDPPFEMLGPFSLDELETRGRVAFAACIVMSRQRWRDDQVELRREAYERRRAAEERLNAGHGRFREGRRRRRSPRQDFDERRYRETLKLPIDGTLEPSQIKAAYRRLAQKVHPDVGGSHDRFVLITEARNALLERIS